MESYIESIHNVFDKIFKSVAIMVSGVVVMQYAETIAITYDPMFSILIIKLIGFGIAILGFLLGLHAITKPIAVLKKSDVWYKKIINLFIFVVILGALLMVLLAGNQAAFDKLAIKGKSL